MTVQKCIRRRPAWILATFSSSSLMFACGEVGYGLSTGSGGNGGGTGAAPVVSMQRSFAYADPITITVTASQGFGITFSGTDNGAPFLLRGSAIGFIMEVDGTIGGEPVKWFTVYNYMYNVFLVFVSDATLVGKRRSLHSFKSEFSAGPAGKNFI